MKTGLDHARESIDRAKAKSAQTFTPTRNLNYFSFKDGEKKILRFLTDDLLIAHFYEFVCGNDGRPHDFLYAPDVIPNAEDYVAKYGGKSFERGMSGPLVDPRQKERIVGIAVLRDEVPAPGRGIQVVDHTEDSEFNGKNYKSRWFGIVKQASGNFWDGLLYVADRMDGSLCKRDWEIKREGSGLDCYLDDTEFLTRRGWLLYDQIEDADELGTINQETGQVEFQQPVDRIAKDYSGPILTSKGRYSQWAVTPNHRMWVSTMRDAQGRRASTRAGSVVCDYDAQQADWQFRRADEVARPSYVWHQQVAAVPSEKEYPVSDSYLALVGAYVSEGAVAKRRDGSISALCFDQKIGGRLHEIMETVKMEYSLKESHFPSRPHVTNWRLSDPAVANEFAKSCGVGSKNKQLPEWTLQLSGRQANVLIESLMAGDGTPQAGNNGKGWVYYTQSSKLAGDIQAVAILAGRRANDRGPYVVRPDRMHQVLIHDSGDSPYSPLWGSWVKKIYVTGSRIVCFTVPNETLVTRRNGHVAMHGNTKYHFIALDPDPDLTEIDTVQSFYGYGKEVDGEDPDRFLYCPQTIPQWAENYANEDRVKHWLGQKDGQQPQQSGMDEFARGTSHNNDEAQAQAPAGTEFSSLKSRLIQNKTV